MGCAGWCIIPACDDACVQACFQQNKTKQNKTKQNKTKQNTKKSAFYKKDGRENLKLSIVLHSAKRLREPPNWLKSSHALFANNMTLCWSSVAARRAASRDVAERISMCIAA